MSVRPLPDKFLVAFSFAGEQRDLVRSIAEVVEQSLGRGTVFFDEWFEHYIAGADADFRIRDIFGNSIVVVLCISARWSDKPWSHAEHQTIRDCTPQIRLPTKSFLPLRVGDGDVEGIFIEPLQCYDIRHIPADQTAKLIIDRLRQTVPNGDLSSRDRTPRVFLAQCTPDLDDRGRMKAFLEELGWQVLPCWPYPSDQEPYRSQLERDLKECLAFVQLISHDRSGRLGFDRIQNETAEKLGVRRFRYRSPNIDLNKVKDASHRDFLVGPDVIVCPFEDFKIYVQKELAALVGHAGIDSGIYPPHPPPNRDNHPKEPRSARNSRPKESPRDIFLSYARPDIEIARALAEALEQEAWSVWWDTKNIRAGQMFHKIIQDALDTARCVIVLWSEQSCKSTWVIGEADVAREADKLVPVKIEQCEIPIQFRGFHTRDLTRWKSSARSDDFQMLLDDIRLHVNRP